jgi:hypothetical protein
LVALAVVNNAVYFTPLKLPHFPQFPATFLKEANSGCWKAFVVLQIGSKPQSTNILGEISSDFDL